MGGAGFFSHPFPGPSATRVAESVLGLLDTAGFPQVQAVAMMSGFIALNFGWSSFVLATPAGGADSVRWRPLRAQTVDAVT